MKDSHALTESIEDAFSSATETLRRRKWALLFLTVVVIGSTLIFSFVERHSLFDSFYWTITVMSTVGFGDITPHTAAGKVLFIFVAISGINTYIYLITSWQSSLVEARLERKLWKLTESANKDPKSNAHP